MSIGSHMCSMDVSLAGPVLFVYVGMWICTQGHVVCLCLRARIRWHACVFVRIPSCLVLHIGFLVVRSVRGAALEVRKTV